MSEFVANNVSSGAVIFASDHNEMGSRIAAVVNGGLENTNISDTAAIATTKLADDAGIGTGKLADDAVTGAKVNFGGAGSGIWWEEIGRTTLGTAGNTMSVASLPARKYLLIYVSALPTGGTININARFNNDSAAHYAARSSTNGAADGVGTATSSMGLSAFDSAVAKFVRAEVINIAAIEKLMTGSAIEVGVAGASTAPSKLEFANKWANTADQVARVDILNVGTGNFAVGSEVVLLGHN